MKGAISLKARHQHLAAFQGDVHALGWVTQGEGCAVLLQQAYKATAASFQPFNQHLAHATVAVMLLATCGARAGVRPALWSVTAARAPQG